MTGSQRLALYSLLVAFALGTAFGALIAMALT
jgi:hypothetical protein